MLKQTAKRGFTITELVIVIVVIAILAAVLIPTFASLIKKANQSADIQGARQMDTALQAGSAEKKPAELKDVIIILDEAGFNIESLKPITKGHTFYWNEETNVIMLVEDATKKVMYPKKVDSYDEAKVHNLVTGKGYIKVEAKTADDVVAALTSGQSVTLTENVELNQTIAVTAGADVTVNLNGKTLTTTKAGDKHLYAIDNSGTVTIENGTINARGIRNLAGAEKMILKNVTLNAADSDGGGIWSNGGEIVIESGKYTSSGNVTILGNSGGTMTVNGGTFEQNGAAYVFDHISGDTVINGGTFVGNRGGLYVKTGTATINGGTFEVKGTDSNAMHAVGCWNATVAINGGTFSTAGQSAVLGIASEPGVAGTGSITYKAGVTIDGVKQAADGIVKK